MSGALIAITIAMVTMGVSLCCILICILLKRRKKEEEEQDQQDKLVGYGDEKL
jgi:heme/copper-type cytochrome/quinol oxidase subunit 2